MLFDFYVTANAIHERPSMSIDSESAIGADHNIPGDVPYPSATIANTVGTPPTASLQYESATFHDSIPNGTPIYENCIVHSYSYSLIIDIVSLLHCI